MNSTASIRPSSPTFVSAPQSPATPSSPLPRDKGKGRAINDGYFPGQASPRASSAGIHRTGSDPITRDRLPAFDGTHNQKANMVRAYGWMAASLGVTAATACVAAAALPPLGLMGSVAVFGAQLGLLAAVCHSADPAQKSVLNLAFNASMGVMMGGMVSVVGAPVLMAAGAYTAGLVGTMTAASLTFPAGSFSSWDGPLLSGLVGLVVAGAITACLPAAWGVTASLSTHESIVGLGLFSAFIVRDTSRMAQAAQMPREQFDPIDASMTMYLDIINIFVRIVDLMSRAENNRNR